MKAFLKRLRESGVHMEFGQDFKGVDGIQVAFHGRLRDGTPFSVSHVISCEVLNGDFDMSIPAMLNMLLDGFLRKMEMMESKRGKETIRVEQVEG